MTQSTQYTLTKEHIPRDARNPHMTSGMLMNLGVSGSLGFHIVPGMLLNIDNCLHMVTAAKTGFCSCTIL